MSVAISECRTVLEAVYEDPLYDDDDGYEEGQILDVGEPMDIEGIAGAHRSGEDEQVLERSTSCSVAVCPDATLGMCDTDQDSLQDKKGQFKPPSTTKGGVKKQRYRRQGPKMDVKRYVHETCHHLQEKKLSLMWEAVKKLGIGAIQDLVKEVDVIEKCGGQLTLDGKRRRTPGGVLWNILKARVQPDVYKEIMSRGNEAEKQKTREFAKRRRMDVDQPINSKRLKVEDKSTASNNISEMQKESEGHSRQPKLSKQAKVAPLRNASCSAPTQLQNAWVAGVKMKGTSNELKMGTPTGAVVQKNSKAWPALNNQQGSLSERIRMPVSYDDIVCCSPDHKLERKPV